MTVPAHGTITRYKNYRCGCRLCTTANREQQRQWKQQRAPLKADDHRHGSVNGYVNYDCRCRPCREAHTAYYRQRRASPT